MLKGTYTHSEETRNKISQKLKGRKLSKEHRENITQALINDYKLGVRTNKHVNKRGSEAPNWKGGISSQQVTIRNSPEYKEWRLAVFKRDDYTCQRCKTRGGKLHVDHIKQFADYPELRFSVDNGRTLCRACHYFITFGKEMPVNSKWGIKTKIVILDKIYIEKPNIKNAKSVAASFQEN